jgi:hypothetical protein
MKPRRYSRSHHGNDTPKIKAEVWDRNGEAAQQVRAELKRDPSKFHLQGARFFSDHPFLHNHNANTFHRNFTKLKEDLVAEGVFSGEFRVWLLWKKA